MTVKLLVGSAIQRQIKTLMKAGDKVSIAVAYWGDGGATKTGVSTRNRKGSRILCDLFSGCCNPVEMRKLIECAEVRTLDGLHAKVWCTSDKVLIGSANASANGLGYEGDETRGNIEACALVDEPTLVQATQEWFETTWNSRNCRQVNSDMIDDAEPIWNARRSGRHRPSSMTLTEALKRPDRLDRFRNVRIIAFRSGITKEQRRIADLVEQMHYSQQQLEIWPSEYPFYFNDVDWIVRPQDIYLDFETPRNKGKFTFHGIFQIRDKPNFTVEGQKLILCNPLLDLNGIRVSQDELRILCSDVRKWAENRNWETDEFNNLVDLPLTQFLPSRWPEARPGII